MVLSLSVGICLFCKTTGAIDSTQNKRNEQSTRTTKNTYCDTKSLFITGWSKLLDQDVHVLNWLQYPYSLDAKTRLAFPPLEGTTDQGTISYGFSSTS